MRTQISKKTMCIAGILGTIGIIYANNQNIYREFEERQTYKEEIQEQGETIRHEFEQALEKSISDLKRKDNYIVIRSASWCIPCKELERQLKQRGSLDQVVIIEAHNRAEEITSRLALENLDIKTPSIPTIIVKKNGATTVYIGAQYSSSTPQKYVTFDEKENEINIDELIKK